MFDPAVEIQRALDVCETKHETIIMICGLLLGARAKASGEPFVPEDPNQWPGRLVAEMRRVHAIPDRPQALTEWFQCAGATLVEMRRIHGLTAPS
jgi:hypothetical protein